MDTNSQKPEPNDSPNAPPDWRNTLYQFHEVAVEKYKLKPREIAIFTTLFSKVKSNGQYQMGNVELMKKCGISNKESFQTSRDKLVSAGIIEIVKKGNMYGECTVYKIKLLGPPNLPPKER